MSEVEKLSEDGRSVFLALPYSCLASLADSPKDAIRLVRACETLAKNHRLPSVEEIYREAFGVPKARGVRQRQSFLE